MNNDEAVALLAMGVGMKVNERGTIQEIIRHLEKLDTLIKSLTRTTAMFVRFDFNRMRSTVGYYLKRLEKEENERK